MKPTKIIVLVSFALLVGGISGWYLKSYSIEQQKRKLLESTCETLFQSTRDLIASLAEPSNRDVQFQITPNQESARQERGRIILTDQPAAELGPQNQSQLENLVKMIGPSCGRAKQVQLQNKLNAAIAKQSDRKDQEAAQ